MFFTRILKKKYFSVNRKRVPIKQGWTSLNNKYHHFTQ